MCSTARCSEDVRGRRCVVRRGDEGREPGDDDCGGVDGDAEDGERDCAIWLRALIRSWYTDSGTATRPTETMSTGPTPMAAHGTMDVPLGVSVLVDAWGGSELLEG
jgi:hypothetical protein